ncbi:uncharacterized protein PAC_03062 [Phialocephala subalpina]|uniref:Uncharacterized protein n=1 Tax=Phialocephala subalpina TaxID=576137 RepID=A0A1L7WK81_9HELO|nr:uncharacterized protein PAC_03062 [Phialocephala subalpina]
MAFCSRPDSTSTSLRSVAFYRNFLSCPERIAYFLLRLRNIEEIIMVARYRPEVIRGRLTLSDISNHRTDESILPPPNEAHIGKLREIWEEIRRVAVLHVYVRSICKGYTELVEAYGGWIYWQGQTFVSDEKMEELVDPAEVEKIFKHPALKIMAIAKEGVSI